MNFVLNNPSTDQVTTKPAGIRQSRANKKKANEQQESHTQSLLFHEMKNIPVKINQFHH